MEQQELDHVFVLTDPEAGTLQCQYCKKEQPLENVKLSATIQL